jgi:hypothetical protein
LIAVLDKALGKPLIGNSAIIDSMIKSNPARVFRSRLGRIEVNQPIARPGGRSPEGPHTHFLPHLLGSEPTEAIPLGWSAQALAYPPHPLRGHLGQPKAFDRAQHDRFQSLLARFGDPRHLLTKGAVFRAVRGGASPAASLEAPKRASSIQVALRQLRELDGDSENLRRWRLHYAC